MRPSVGNVRCWTAQPRASATATDGKWTFPPRSFEAGGEWVIARFYAPTLSPGGEYQCRWEIEWPDRTQRHRAHGIDGVQALNACRALRPQRTRRERFVPRRRADLSQSKRLPPTLPDGAWARCMRRGRSQTSNVCLPPIADVGATRSQAPASAGWSDLRPHRQCKCVLDVVTEIADDALNFGVTEQNLHRS